LVDATSLSTGPRIVAVSGACSRAGKTAAAVSLLHALGAAMAVKFTVTEDVFSRCPRGTPCVVCDIDVPFRIVEDPAVLRQPGTDTDRLAAAGASRVLWAITRESAAPAAWAAVRARLENARHVVLEGSTVVSLARPAAVVFVAHPFLSPTRWKPTTATLVKEADHVVVNRPRRETREPEAGVLAELRRYRAGRSLVIADVTAPVPTWAPGLVETLQPAAHAATGDPG
jgi:hypothetical protein